jgi:hypothetical protein
MKKMNFIYLFLLIFISIGCGSSKEQKPEEPILPINLNKISVVIWETPLTDNSIHITGGNGGYRIVLPKKIEFIITGTNGKTETEYVDCSEDILTISIDSENRIVIEDKLQTNQEIEGKFMVTDSKGAKKIFMVLVYPGSGGVIGWPVGIADPSNIFDLNAYLEDLMNNHDYWQW